MSLLNDPALGAFHWITKNESLVQQLKEDYTKASLDSKDRAILDYSVKLTRKPTSVTQEDIQQLRNAGCGDQKDWV